MNNKLIRHENLRKEESSKTKNMKRKQESVKMLISKNEIDNKKLKERSRKQWSKVLLEDRYIIYANSIIMIFFNLPTEGTK